MELVPSIILPLFRLFVQQVELGDLDLKIASLGGIRRMVQNQYLPENHEIFKYFLDVIFSLVRYLAKNFVPNVTAVQGLSDELDQIFQALLQMIEITDSVKCILFLDEIEALWNTLANDKLDESFEQLESESFILITSRYLNHDSFSSGNLRMVMSECLCFLLKAKSDASVKFEDLFKILCEGVKPENVEVHRS